MGSHRKVTEKDVSSQGCGALAYFGSFSDSGQVCAVLADGNGDLDLGGQPMGCTATCCLIAPGLVIIAGLRGFALGSRSTWVVAMDSGAKAIEVFFFVGECCIGFIDVLFLAFKIQV